MATFQDYLQATKSTIRQPIYKLEFLRDNETPLFEIVDDIQNNGSLSIENKNGTRRSLSMTLDNISKKYFPDLENVIWIGKKCRLSLGYKVNNEEYFITNGVFVMDDPTLNSNSNNYTISINAIDKFGMLDGTLGGEFDSIVIINAGTSLVVAINSLMGLSSDPKQASIDVAYVGATLPYNIIKEEGQTIGDTLEELALAFSANVFYNEDGTLVFEKDISDLTKGVLHEFTVDLTETNYQQGNSTFKFRDVYNSVLVIGNNVNGLIARAKVQNNDLLSQTSIPNLGYERVLVVKDNIINTTNLATQRGIYELKRSSALVTQNTLTSTPMYHLDVDRVVSITDPYLNFTKKRSVIQSINIPLGSGSMSLTLVDSFETSIA